MPNWLVKDEAPYSQTIGSDDWAGKQSQVPLSPALVNPITAIPHSTNVPNMSSISTMTSVPTMTTSVGKFTVSPLATSAPIQMSPTPFMTSITSSAGVYTPAPLGARNPTTIGPLPTSGHRESTQYTPGVSTTKPVPINHTEMPIMSNTVKPVSEHFTNTKLTSVPIKAAYTVNIPTKLKKDTIKTHVTPMTTTTTHPVAFITQSPTLSSTPY